MQSPELRDKGLHRVRRLTIWMGGVAVVATGMFAGWFDRPQPSSATTTPVTDPAASADSSSTVPPTTSRSQSPTPSNPQSNATPTSPPTTVRPRSTAPVAPPSAPPRSGRRRPAAGSGGS